MRNRTPIVKTVLGSPIGHALTWAGAGTALRICLGFVSAKVSAVFLGPSGIALVGDVSNFIQISTGAISGGANDAVVNLTAERRTAVDGLHRLWVTTIALVLALGVVVIVAASFAATRLSSALLFSGAYWPVIVVASIAVTFAAMDSVILGALNGLGQVGLVASAGMIASVVEFGVFVALTSRFGVWGGLLGMAALYVGRLAVSTTVAVRSRLIRLRPFWAAIDPATLRAIARFYPMLVVNSIAFPLAQILVRNGTARAFGLQQAGYLQAVWRLSDIYVGVLTTALSLYFMAGFASQPDDARRGDMLRRTMLQLFVLTALSASLVYALRDVVISVVLTKEFAPMRDLLPFQLAGDVIRMVDAPLQMALVSRRRTGSYILQAVGGPATYVALAVLWRPAFGAESAPLAYAASYVFRLIVLTVALRGILTAKEPASPLAFAPALGVSRDSA